MPRVRVVEQLHQLHCLQPTELRQRPRRDALRVDTPQPPAVAAAFDELYKQHRSIVTALVKSAAPLNEATRAKVRALAEKQHPGKTVELEEVVDPSLIGGLTIRIGDEQYDGSVSRRLGDLRRKFSENPYIPEI